MEIIMYPSCPRCAMSIEGRFDRMNISSGRYIHVYTNDVLSTHMGLFVDQLMKAPWRLSITLQRTSTGTRYETRGYRDAQNKRRKSTPVSWKRDGNARSSCCMKRQAFTSLE